MARHKPEVLQSLRRVRPVLEMARQLDVLLQYHGGLLVLPRQDSIFAPGDVRVFVHNNLLSTFTINESDPLNTLFAAFTFAPHSIVAAGNTLVCDTCTVGVTVTDGVPKGTATEYDVVPDANAGFSAPWLTTSAESVASVYRRMKGWFGATVPSSSEKPAVGPMGRP